jgi:uncharacterized membrane protein YfcA
MLQASLGPVVGLLIGLVMGFTGAGGGVLAVPALVLLLGLSMQQAAPVALIGVALAAWAGAWMGLRAGVVRWRAALVIALSGWPFSALGVFAAHAVSDLLLRAAFVGLLVFVAWRQWRSRASAADRESWGTRRAVATLNPETGRFEWNTRAFLGFGAIGSVTGFLSGLLGVAGGFVLVPLLRAWTALRPRALAATSLLVTALVTSFGALFSLRHGAAPPAATTAWFAGTLVLGVLLARQLSHRVDEKWIARAFLGLLLVVAVAMSLDLALRLGWR